MSILPSQITSLAIVYSTVYSGGDQRKHQSSMSMAFVRGIYHWPVNSGHKGPVTPKMFPFDDEVMFSDYITPMPVKQPWRMWVINHMTELVLAPYQNKTRKQSTNCMEYTVYFFSNTMIHLCCLFFAGEHIFTESEVCFSNWRRVRQIWYFRWYSWPITYWNILRKYH